MIDIDIIQKKAVSIAEAVFRISKVYPHSAHCQGLYRVAERISESVQEYHNKEVEFHFGGFTDLIADFMHLLAKVEKEAIVPGINLVILRKNIEHLQMLVDTIKPIEPILHNKEAASENPILFSSMRASAFETPNNADNAERGVVEVSKSIIAVKNALTGRQEALLALFSGMQERNLQLKEIMVRFSDVSDRMIRLDLSELVRLGYIIQRGFGRGSFYSPTSSQKTQNMGQNTQYTDLNNKE